MLCSSTVTTRLVFKLDSRIASLSTGFKVDMFITSGLMPLPARIWAASSVFGTMDEHVIIETSLPALNVFALPSVIL